MSIQFHLIWRDQCEAAEGIKEEFGTDKALGYLIGEKLVNFVKASGRHQDFARELPNFVAGIKEVFEPHEIRGYLDNVKRIGPSGHICSDEEHEFLRDHDVSDEDPVRAAEDILVMDRIREMLLQ